MARSHLHFYILLNASLSEAVITRELRYSGLTSGTGDLSRYFSNASINFTNELTSFATSIPDTPSTRDLGTLGQQPSLRTV
jgi:uncharacterized membrane protein YjjB (DUF3815 family)